MVNAWLEKVDNPKVNYPICLLNIIQFKKSSVVD